MELSADEPKTLWMRYAGCLVMGLLRTAAAKLRVQVLGGASSAPLWWEVAA